MIPLVFVHVFMGGSAQWEAQRTAWPPNHPLITLDLPGFGANAQLPPLPTITGYALWVIAELRRLGIDRYHLLGHSMGGMIAQEIARHDQDRITKLVLYGTGAAGVLPGRFETIAQSKARAQADGAQKTARRIAATWFLDTQDAAGFEACAAIAEQTTLEAIQAGLDAMQAWSGTDFLSQIDVETCVIWGDCDRTYGWSQIAQLWDVIPDTQLAVVPGCAHAPHAEKPLIFNAILQDFIYGSQSATQK